LSLALLGGALALAALPRPPRARNAPLPSGEPLPLADWLAQLHAARGALRIGVSHIDREVAPSFRVARALAQWLGDRGAVARVARSGLIWFAREPTTLGEVMIACAGALRAPVVGPTAPDGSAALEAAHAAQLLPPPLLALLADTPATREQRACALTASHPGAVILDLAAPRLRVPPGVSQRAFVRHTLRALARASQGQPRSRCGELELRVISPGGPIVVLPAKAD
jgi:hypothetical protein